MAVTRYSDRFRYATIAELSMALRCSEVSAVELAMATCAVLSELGPRYNALASLLRERSAAEARAADERLVAGEASLLCGIPYGAKDLFAAQGAPTTWGCRAFQDQRIEEDAVVITRLRDAGAVLVAKTTMVELAGAGRPASGASLHGQGRNPWKVDRYSGGSSSGSAIAVAAGLLPYALGTETGGSIVGPAAFCGVTGIRPTFGLVPRTGLMPVSRSLDKVGVIARAADDCASVMAVIAGPDGADVDCQGSYIPVELHPDVVGRLRVGVIARDAQEWKDVARRQLSIGLADLTNLLPQSIALTFDLDPQVNSAIDTIISYEAAINLREHLVGAGFVTTDPGQVERLRRALFLTEDELAQAHRLREAAVSIAERLFAEVDFLVVASRTGTAPLLGGPPSERTQSAADQMRSLANLAGLPGVTMPCGLADDGLPVGLHLVGPRGSEALLLAIASDYQKATDYHLRQPSDQLL